MELRVCNTCRAVRPGATLCPGCSGALSFADAGLFLGERFGKYQLESVLGAGGMGVVYAARHVTLRRSAAVKVVVPHVADAAFERRFLREARVLAELKHPHIVEIYDFDVSSWGLPYYVMEYLEGCTLRRLIERAPRGVSQGVLAALLEDITAGLTFAHRKGVVHRDLKSDNVFIARFDARALVKLLDFGIAKLISDSTDDTATLTAAGAVVGTPQYLAPEQILAGVIGPRTDQYTLALIVAEALSGRAVRAGKTLMQILAQDIHRPPDLEALPADTPSARREALRRAGQPDPAARFADVAEFVAALALPAPDRAALAALLPRPVGDTPQAPWLTSTLDGTGPTPTPDETPGASTATALELEPGAPDNAPTSVTGVGGTPAATVPAAPAARPRPATRSRARILAACGAAAALLVAAAVAWQARRAPLAGPEPHASAAGPPRPHLRRTLAVPPDATGLLACDGDTLALAAEQALYLQRLDGAQAPTRIALGDGELVLGRAQENGVWLRAGAGVVRLDPLSQKRTPWLQRLPRSAAGAPDAVHVSPDGRHAALVEPRRIAACEVTAGACTPRFVVERPAGAAVRVSLSDAYLALAWSRRSLEVYRLGDGRRLLQAPLAEAQVHDVALLDDAGRVAVGGWFPYVEVHDFIAGTPSTRVARQGRTTRLAWLPDAPTLLLAGPSGTHTWRAAEGLRDMPDDRTRRGETGDDDILMTAHALIVLQGDTHRVALYDYDGFTPARRLKLGSGSVWALASDPGSGRLFAGTSAGTLYAYTPGAASAQPYELHGDGITDLVVGGGALGSTSDDKTLAVWRLPEVSVTWRSRAHDYLVNQLALVGDPPSLWSSSSDGALKRWGWPQPDERESLDTRRLVPGGAWALHALWAAADGTHVLAGTWQHTLLDLRRAADGTWSGLRVPVESRTLYRALELRGLEAVLFVGLEPSRVVLYDLRRQRLERLPSFGLSTYTAAPGDAPGEAWVLGEGAALRYLVRREPDGALVCAAAAHVATGLGVALSAVRVGPHALALGLETGEIAWLDTTALETPALGRVRFAAP